MIVSSSRLRRGFSGPQRGFALVVVLWVVALLALQVSLFNLNVRDATSLAGNELAVLRGETLATAGIEIAVARMLERDPSRRWRADGSTREITIGGSLVMISIRDEATRIDINEADADLLASMMHRFERNPSTVAQWVDRIIDWRDSDSDPRPHGAEAPDYRRAGLSYGPNNGPLIDPSELSRVLGFPDDVAQALARYVTVYGGDGEINPEFAPREVLMSLPGGNEATIDRVMDWVRRGGMTTGSGTPAQLAPFRKWLTDRQGPAFRIEVAVRSDGVPAIGAAEAVVLIGKDSTAPFRTLSWRYEPGIVKTQTATARK
jgi:general secretion pathway protein K